MILRVGAGLVPRLRTRGKACGAHENTTSRAGRVVGGPMGYLVVALGHRYHDNHVLRKHLIHGYLWLRLYLSFVHVNGKVPASPSR